MPDTTETTQPETAKPARLNGLSALREAALNLARGARHELVICSSELEPALYNNGNFVGEISRVARSGRHARVRVLIRDNDPIVKHGHALVRLAQLLPSYIEIRRVMPEHRDNLYGYLVTDEGGVLYQPQVRLFQAKIATRNRRWARDLLSEFQRLWERAETDLQLRRLPLNS